jgi:hypothetical protein
MFRGMWVSSEFKKKVFRKHSVLWRLRAKTDYFWYGTDQKYMFLLLITSHKTDVKKNTTFVVCDDIYNKLAYIKTYTIPTKLKF